MGVPVWDAAWQQAWAAFLVFWKHWYGKIAVGGVATVLVRIVKWLVNIRTEWHKGTAAKEEVKKLKAETAKRIAEEERQDSKNRIVDYVRGRIGTTAGDAAEEFGLELNETVTLMMELEKEKRIWHTNNGRWMFGPKPPFLS